MTHDEKKTLLEWRNSIINGISSSDTLLNMEKQIIKIRQIVELKFDNNDKAHERLFSKITETIKEVDEIKTWKERIEGATTLVKGVVGFFGAANIGLIVIIILRFFL